MSTQASQSRREHLRGEPKPTPQDRSAYLRVSIVHQLPRVEHVLQNIQKSRREETKLHVQPVLVPVGTRKIKPNCYFSPMILFPSIQPDFWLFWEQISTDLLNIVPLGFQHDFKGHISYRI